MESISKPIDARLLKVGDSLDRSVKHPRIVAAVRQLTIQPIPFMPAFEATEVVHRHPVTGACATVTFPHGAMARVF